MIVGPPLVGTGVGRATVIEVAMGAIINLTFALIAILKGKLWTVFGHLVAVRGFRWRVRPARPNSPWACARDAKKPGVMARAVAREEHRHGRAGRFRDWFYDLIAGKPSMPPRG